MPVAFLALCSCKLLKLDKTKITTSANIVTVWQINQHHVSKDPQNMQLQKP